MQNLTLRQKEALAMGKSLCITAGAGTGKTFLLSKRYLMLLTRLREQNGNATVSEILALTFTEKAANEMYKKIELDIRELVVSATDDEDGLFWTTILHELFRSSITTFHGFCASVLREFALDVGLDPSFDILNEMEKQVLITMLIRNILTRPPKSLYLDCVLLFEDLISPEEVIADILPKYHEFQHHFPKTDEGMDACIRKWRYLMLATVQKRMTLFFSEETVSAISNLIDLAECYGDGDDLSATYLRRILPALRQLRKDSAADTFCSVIAAIREANGNSTGARLGNKVVYGADLDRLRRSFRLLRSAIDSIPKEWSRIPDLEDAFSRESVRVIAALGCVVDEIFHRYQQEKQQRGVLDFEDLVRMTAEVIEIPGVLRVLQRRFSYILVDEVQDTDPTQSAIVWKIVGALTPSNDAVFIVGDPKQSIYAFRNADICEVNSMQERIISGCGTQSIVLDVSFRSTKEVLGVVNSIFSRLFSETTEEWDVSYDPISVSSLREKDTGTVQILKTIPVDSTPPSLLEAREIAAHIRELIASRITIRDEHGKRPARFGDIAVLLENRNSQAMFEHALREANVPHNIYNSQGFYRSQEIIDITLLLSVVAGLGDDVALYGVLRSPYFGISDADLCIVGDGSYYDRISRYAMDNPNSRIASSLEKLQIWRNRSGTESLSGFLRRILRESDMHMVYGGMQNGKHSLANLEKLIGIARSQELKRVIPLSEFVRMLVTGIEQNLKEGVAQVDLLDGDAVRIMTVHASKGLEFPIVILANLDNYKISHGTGPVLDKKLGVGLSIRTRGAKNRSTETFVKMFTREIREAKDIAEKKRLFYVAMTRARDHLILSYVCGRDSPPKNSRAAWLTTYLLPKENPSSSFTFVTDDGISVDISVIERRSSGSVVPDVAMSATRLPVDFQHIWGKMDENRKIARCKVSATHLDHSDQETFFDISASAVYEIVLHGVFQGLNVPMLCKKYRLNEEICTSLLRSYEAFLNSPLMQNVADEFCELPFSVEIFGKQFTGTIDRLVRYADGSWCVIDYKFCSMMAVGVNEMKDYRCQLSIYVAVVRQLFSVEASACIYFVQDEGIMEMSLDESKFSILLNDR